MHTNNGEIMNAPNPDRILRFCPSCGTSVHIDTHDNPLKYVTCPVCFSVAAKDLDVNKMVIECPYCKKATHEESIFCANCGRKITERREYGFPPGGLSLPNKNRFRKVFWEDTTFNPNCPHCGKKIHSNFDLSQLETFSPWNACWDGKCSSCGHEFKSEFFDSGVTISIKPVLIEDNTDYAYQYAGFSITKKVTRKVVEIGDDFEKCREKEITTEQQIDLSIDELVEIIHEIRDRNPVLLMQHNCEYI